jgi:hypothetical protein
MQIVSSKSMSIGVNSAGEGIALQKGISEQLRQDKSGTGRLHFGAAEKGESVWRIRPPEATIDWSRTAATRYLCAGAHLFPDFRSRVIEEFIEQKHRALVMSDGVDMTLVLIHCLAARRRTNKRDVALAVAFAAALAGILVATGGSTRNVEPVLLAAGVLYLVAAAIILFVEEWAGYRLVVRNLLSQNYNPQCVDYELDPELRATLEKMCAARESKAVIYSGFSPFVGCGGEVNGWSFSLDASKPAEGDLRRNGPVQQFRLEELYTEVADAVQRIGLRNVIVEDKLFVNGRDIGNEPVLLPDPFDRPRALVDASTVLSHVDGRSTRTRFYKNIKVVDWDGELVLNIFLRFTRPGSDLFVEASYFLLTPLKSRFHAIDSWNPALKTHMFLKKLFESALMAVVSPFMPIGNVLDVWGRRQRRGQIREMIKTRPHIRSRRERVRARRGEFWPVHALLPETRQRDVRQDSRAPDPGEHRPFPGSTQHRRVGPPAATDCDSQPGGDRHRRRLGCQ